MRTGVLFDLDGTLLDTLADLTAAVNYALAAFGYPARTGDEVRRFIGNGIACLMSRSVPANTPAEKTTQALAVFREYYRQHNNEKTRPYCGVVQALNAVHEKCPVAVVSNKIDMAAKALCGQYFPGIYTLGERPGCPNKPAPDMVWQAMKAVKIDRCIYVGDTEVDILTAKNAGAICLCVTWGFRSRKELEAAGGKYFCEKAEDLPDVITGMLAEMGEK